MSTFVGTKTIRYSQYFLRISFSNRKSINGFNIILILVFASLINICSFNRIHAQSLEQLGETSLQYAEMKLEEYLVKTTPGLYPYETHLDNYQWLTMDRSKWASGYFISSLWLMYKWTEDPWWKIKAEEWTNDMKSEQVGGNTDVAVKIFYSAGFAFRLTGDSSWIDVLKTTSNTFSNYYDEQVGAIQCFPSSWSQYNFAVVTDFLLHMELLLLSAELTGEQKFYDIAINHTNKILAYNMRENGSFCHVSDFDNLGNLIAINQGFIQGYDLDPDSLEYGTWSRGQAWAVRALPIIYRYTKDTAYLSAARKTADYFIDNFPVTIYGDDDYIPYCDYFPDRYHTGNGKDASAASIACAGLYDLSEYDPKYREAADSILKNLCTDYLTKDDPHNYASILKRSMHKYGEPERGHIFADYFFIEALLLSRGTDITERVGPLSGISDKAVTPEENAIRIGPNPFLDQFNVMVDDKHLDGTIEVYDMKGRKIYHGIVDAAYLKINLEGHQRGIYVVKINRSSGSSMYKLFKMD